MSRNLGATSLKRRRTSRDAMRDYDRLPPELRVWLSTAVLPWRPHSVRRAYDKALKATANRAAALAELDRVEHAKIARDARAVWGAHHPAAAVGGAE